MQSRSEYVVYLYILADMCMQQMSVFGAAMLLAVGTFPVFGGPGIERPGSGPIGSSTLLQVTTRSLSRACPTQSGEALVHGIPGCVEEVSFQSGDLRLASQWFTPREAVAAVPAAVVVRGSGDSVRGNPWTESLVAVLLEAGFGVLVPDKRGSGHSEGDWRTAHFVDLADDATAAVRYLSGRPDVLGSRIGLMGLSQGGQVAPVAAARSDSISFVISVVGGAVPFFENVRFEMHRTFEEEGLAGDRLASALRMVDSAVDYLSGRLSWEAYAHALLETRAIVGDRIMDEYFIHTRDHWRWDFFRRLEGFDPVDWWRQVRQPALVLLGRNDRNTPTAETAARLRRVFQDTGHSDATVRVFDGLGHDLMDHSAPGPMSEHGLRPDVRDTLADWARRVAAR